MAARPNILFLVSDQERQRDWIPGDLHDLLPARSRLLAEGKEFTRHYTHSSPCSPSRATLFTGQYVPEHGVTDNVFLDPVHPDLHTGTPTLGHILRAAGYRTSYLGKWHLSYGNPRMEAYGFSDWTGEDWAWTGLAGTGTHFDNTIAAQAVDWLGQHGAGPDPWCLVVGLVNPHDIAWYPADQAGYQVEHAERSEAYASILPVPIPSGGSIPAYQYDYPALFDLPDNFDDTLVSKPSVQKTWQWEDNHWHYGWLEPHDRQLWCRALDYYFDLHRRSDAHLAAILDALDASGAADDTVVVFTSDHGEMCGGHGLRGKGPFAYEEIMHVPLYVRAPGLVEAGTRCDSLTSSVDIAPTVTELAGAGEGTSFSGVDLGPLLDGGTDPVRDVVLFAQQQGWHRSCVSDRFALRGWFDGRAKYVRYYGVGGGVDSLGRGIPWSEGMRFGPDADLFDQEHELYDLAEDPGEMQNLAVDGSRRSDVSDAFDLMLELEAAAFTHERPTGMTNGSTHESGMMDHAGYDSDVDY